LTKQSSVGAVSHSRARLAVNFLGSMRLAVSLLVLLAIASVIGTVLNQQQPYQDYALKFGPFWFDVFRDIGLYNVYRTNWYLAIVGFLVLSTTTCLIRNTPRMLREMREPDTAVASAYDPRGMANNIKIISPLSMDSATHMVAAVMRGRGYRPKLHDRGDGSMAVIARKGRYNRLGYILTHAAIIVFCAAALYNADIPVKLAMLVGSIRPENNFHIPLSEVSKAAWLPYNNPAYRGTVTVPEGQSTQVAYELVGNGYLVQPLPFRIMLRRFHVTYYSTGMPKDFISNIVLYSNEGKVLKEANVRVNHPLTYKGVQIFQASFVDGGSLLKMKRYMLNNPGADAVHQQARVGQSIDLSGTTYKLKLKGFSLDNVVPAAAIESRPSATDQHINLGPSFTYIAQSDSGSGAEFKTYMQPITRDGQSYFVQGVRTAFGTPYEYLFIPTGPNGNIGLFMKYLSALQQQATADSSENTKSYVLNTFKKVVAEYAPSMTVDAEAAYFQSAISAILQLKAYPVPFIVTLTGFDHRWAAGLEVTKWPATVVIYWGCAVLVLGIFILFYLPQRRLSVVLRALTDGTEVIIGGTSSRNPYEFTKEFEGVVTRLRSVLRSQDDKKENDDG